MAQIRADNREDYVILLDLLAKANDSVKGPSISDVTELERLLDAHRLANKFIAHALTVLNLSRGYKVEELPSFQPVNFTDSWSIDVLTRAAMEAFLIFHYVFYAPTTIEEKDYRYLTYKVAGLAERQNLLAGSPEHQIIRAQEKKFLEELHIKLESNAVFQSLTNKQQNKIFSGKSEWKWKPNGEGVVSWREIATDARLSNMLASHTYSYLSGHAHSSNTSVLQVLQALEHKDLSTLVKFAMSVINVLIANMIREYCGLFSKAQDVLSKGIEGNNLVEQYIQIGRTLDKYMGIGQDND